MQREMSTPERTYTLIIKGQRISVTQAVYKTYYQEYEQYLKNKFVAQRLSISVSAVGYSKQKILMKLRTQLADISP